MGTIRSTRTRAELIAWFVDELVQAQEARPEREGMLSSGETEWVVFERTRLLDLVNQERARLNKPPVDIDAVMRVENSAVGHFDYTSKLALGAADLVLAD
jgi:hypothetical protein